MNPFTVQDNSNMTETERAAWLEQRKSGIGSSDAAAILGLNPYSSPVEVWLDKMGALPPKEMNEAMRFGVDAENYVATRFEELTGKKLSVFANSISGNVKYPFALTSVDRWIIDEGVPVEIKTTSVWNQKNFKHGKYPANYYVQCVHHMAVMDAPYCYLVVYIPGVELMWFKIERDLTEEKFLMEAEKEFYEKYMLTKTMPPVDAFEATSNALSNADFDAVEGSIQLVEAVNAIGKVKALEAEKKRIEGEINKLKNEIKAEMQGAEKAYCDIANISWKNQERKTLDSKKVLEAYPEIAEKNELYNVTTSRVFRISWRDKDE